MNHKSNYGQKSRGNQDNDKTNYQHNVTHSTSKVQVGDKINEMINKIMNQISRQAVPYPIKAISKDQLRSGGSTIFYEVCLIFARAIDDKLQQSDVNSNSPEFVINFLKLFNYPGFLGKNIFQPIGAPHTWIHCLGILDFMAEIAHYTCRFKVHCNQAYMRERELKGDSNYCLRKAILENNSLIYIDNLRQDYTDFKRKNEEMALQVDRAEQTIKHINLQQKSLSQLQREIKNQAENMKVKQSELEGKKIEIGNLEAAMAKNKRQESKMDEQIIGLSNYLDSLQLKLASRELSLEEVEAMKRELTVLKSEYFNLQEQFQDESNRIRSGMREKVNDLRDKYERVHSLINQIFSISIEGQPLSYPVEIVDNFHHLHQLYTDFLESKREGNMTDEFAKIESQWHLSDYMSRVSQILGSLNEQVDQKEHQHVKLETILHNLSASSREIGEQAQLFHKEQTRLDYLQMQFKVERESQQLRGEQIGREWQRVEEKINLLQSAIYDYELETTRLMDEVEALKASTDSFMKNRKEALKVAFQAEERVKVKALQSFRAHTQQTLKLYKVSNEGKQQGRRLVKELAIKYDVSAERE